MIESEVAGIDGAPHAGAPDASQFVFGALGFRPDVKAARGKRSCLLQLGDAL